MDMPIINIRPQRLRNIVQLLVGRVFGNHVVPAVDQRIKGQDVGPGRPVGLEDVLGINVLVKFGNLLLELWRTLDPAVVHLLLVQHCVEFLTIVTVQVKQLVHAYGCNCTLRNVVSGTLFPLIKP